jgi:hypothetical protein
MKLISEIQQFAFGSDGVAAASKKLSLQLY